MPYDLHRAATATLYSYVVFVLGVSVCHFELSSLSNIKRSMCRSP